MVTEVLMGPRSMLVETVRAPKSGSGEVSLCNGEGLQVTNIPRPPKEQVEQELASLIFRKKVFAPWRSNGVVW